MFDGENVWVANTFDDSLMKLSPDGTVLSTFPVGKGPVALTFDGEHLWVANTGLDPTTEEPPPGTVSKLRLTGEVVGEFPVGRWPVAMAFDGQRLWVANLVDKTVMQLSLDGRLVDELTLDLRPVALAVVGDDVWVLTGTDEGNSGAITVLSSSLQVLATYPTSPPHPLALLFDGQSVWVGSSSDSTVTKMAQDGTVLATIELKEAPIGLGFDGESIWVTTFEGLLFQLSLDGQIVSFLPMGNPVAIAWDGRALWTVLPTGQPTTEGLVYRLEVHDATAPSFPLRVAPEAIAPKNADLAQYVLAQDQVQQIPGCAGWTDLPGSDIVEFFLIEDLRLAAVFEGVGFEEALEAGGCGPSEGPVAVDATQVVFRFASQEDATQFMERLRVPAYPFLISLADYSGLFDFETWSVGLDPESFGPAALAMETSLTSRRPLNKLG